MKTIKSLAVAVLLPALGSLGCSSPAQTSAGRPKGVPVRTTVVQAQDLEESLALNGTLHPRSQVQVVAEVAARLVEVVKDEGARVAEGDVLARLDDTDYRLSHDRARAALDVAEANKAHALVEKERADNLLKTGGITDKDHLSAQVSLQVAEASLAQARAEAAIAGQQIARTRIRAPFAGRVARRLADPGAMLASGTPLFTLVDDSVLEFRASVPSADWGRARVGDTVEVTVDARGGRVAPGRVARVTPLVDERTRSFEVVVQVPGRKDLVGGLFARARVRVGRVEGAVVVPPAALVRGGAAADQAEAFVVVDGKADKRTVALGIESSDGVQVTRGLAAGDTVVVDPPATLASGTPVEIQNGRAAKN